jgi:hypothetical protein
MPRGEPGSSASARITNARELVASLSADSGLVFERAANEHQMRLARLRIVREEPDQGVSVRGVVTFGGPAAPTANADVSRISLSAVPVGSAPWMTEQSTTARGDGQFELQSPPLGTYNVRARVLGGAPP